MAEEDDILRRLREFVAQLGHAHSDATHMDSVLRESQELITRQQKKLRVIDTFDEKPARAPRRPRARGRRRRR